MQKILAAVTEAMAKGEVSGMSFADGELTVTFAHTEAAAPKPKRSYTRKPKAKSPVSLSNIESQDGLDIPEALRRA